MSLSPARLALPAVLLAAAVVLLLQFPARQLSIGCIYLVYAGALAVRRDLWALLLPMLLPLLDFAPDTGWHIVDEIDGLMLITLAFLLGSPWRDPPARRYGGLFLLLLPGLVISAAISAWIGWQGADTPAFANQVDDPLNALRLFKAFVWSLLLMPFLRYGKTSQTMLIGFGLAATGIALIAAYERYLFAGPLNFGSIYRVTSTFSSINTGDGPIDVWLAMCWAGLLLIPFMPVPKLVRLVALPCGMIILYAFIATGSRAPVVAVFIGLMIFFAAMALGSAMHGNGRRYGSVAAGGALVTMLLAGGLFLALKGSNLDSRFATLDTDIATREQHWKESLSLVKTPLESVFGIGLGRYASRFRDDVRQGDVGIYGIGTENGRRFAHLMRKPSEDRGENIYLMQSVRIRTGTSYRVDVKARSREAAPAMLHIGLCERWLLTFANHPGGCEIADIRVIPSAPFLPYQGSIRSGETGGGSGWRTMRLEQVTGLPFRALGRRPVKLMIWTDAGKTGVDFTDLSVTDPWGRNLVRNGHFRAGHEQWFWTTQDHLPFHAKNLLVHGRVEQGWLGLATFGSLLLLALLTRLGQLRRDPLISAALLASLTGLVLTGISVSITDQPRNIMLLLLILALCCLKLPRTKIGAQ